MKKAKLFYFKKHGKWYSESEMEITDEQASDWCFMKREDFMDEGRAIGLIGNGMNFHLIVIPQNNFGWPLMFPSELLEV